MTAKEVRVNLGDATARQLLVEWANEQDGWMRKLVTETILARQVPSQDVLDEIYQILLAENQLSEEQPQVPKLEAATSTSEQEDALELITLKDVRGVNALAEDQELHFDSHLTVLFGQNGAGKTGYSRVLKRMSAVRETSTILPNARRDDATSPTPTATMIYRSGADQREARWANEAGLAPFTRLSVFDADVSSIHVDEGLGYVYTPAELAHFGFIAEAIKEIQARSTFEIDQLTVSKNPFVAKFDSGTDVYPYIETLGSTTDLNKIRELATLPENWAERCEELETDIAAIKANTAPLLLKEVTQTEQGLTQLRQMLGMVEQFNTETYEAARHRLEQAESRRAKAREELFESDELPGPADEHWHAFISAGDEYRRHLGKEAYPGPQDKCLYCMQDLDPRAHELLSRYRRFLDESLVQHVKSAAESLEMVSLKLDDNDLAQARAFIRQHESETEVETPKWTRQASIMLASAEAAQAECQQRMALSARNFTSELEEVRTAICDALTEVRQRRESLEEDSTSIAEKLQTRQQDLANLSSKVQLKDLLVEVSAYVERERRREKLEQIVKSISGGVAKALTRQSKKASEDLVNKNFEEFFSEECARLRAPSVALKFQGRSGKAQRKKVVATYKPSLVLSEGEQKVLALADFLAESRLRGAKAPFVFDDPVTSLDYRRLAEVAERIQSLAQTHQVIVLTHNIMFATALVAARQTKGKRTKVYEVRDGGDVKGILAPDVEPRLDQPSDLGKRINIKIESMAKAEPEAQDALIRETYDLIRAWCEAFVEQELLKNVTQRYRHNIMMTRLSQIEVGKFDDAVAVINPLFERACDRMTGHSHAAETLNVKPTVSDVQEDWAKAQAARTAYLKG